jgi:hypothetical protein
MLGDDVVGICIDISFLGALDMLDYYLINNITLASG